MKEKKITSNDCTFWGKEETLIIYGIAILLMIWHHLFIEPAWYSDGVEIRSTLGNKVQVITTFLACFGNICVSIFAFVSGYALYVNSNKFSLKKQIAKLFQFLTAYWLVLFVFYIIGYLNNDEFPSSKTLITNLFGLGTGPLEHYINCSFAWYVAFYIQFIFLSPFLLSIFQKRSKFIDLIACIFILTLVYVSRNWNEFLHPCVAQFFSYSYPFIVVIIGILVAKYKIINRIHSKLASFSKTTILFDSIIIFACLIIGRLILTNMIKDSFQSHNFFYISLLDGFITILIISIILEVFSRYNVKKFRSILIFIGSISTFLWFFHGIFFTGNNFMQKELYFIKEPFLIFLICLILTVPISFILSTVHKYLYSKIKRNTVNKVLDEPSPLNN